MPYPYTDTDYDFANKPSGAFAIPPQQPQPEETTLWEWQLWMHINETEDVEYIIPAGHDIRDFVENFDPHNDQHLIYQRNFWAPHQAGFRTPNDKIYAE